MTAPSSASVQGDLFAPDLPAPPSVTEILAAARARGRKTPRGAPANHRCPAPGCSIYVPMRRIACSDHWFSLPEDLRKQINDTYRRDRRRQLELFREAVRLLGLPSREDPRS